MNLKMFLAAMALAASVVFASSRAGRASGCQASLCNVRSDGNTWCCNLALETAIPNGCYYYNDTGNCTRTSGGIGPASPVAY
jgi:hypothetical protein